MPSFLYQNEHFKDDYCSIDRVPHQILHIIAVLILRLIKQKQRSKNRPYKGENQQKSISWKLYVHLNWTYNNFMKKNGKKLCTCHMYFSAGIFTLFWMLSVGDIVAENYIN